VFGTATSGAENDLKQATQLARKMTLDWGIAVQTLQEYRAELDCVADTFLEKEEIPGEQVFELIGAKR